MECYISFITSWIKQASCAELAGDCGHAAGAAKPAHTNQFAKEPFCRSRSPAGALVGSSAYTLH